MIRFSNPTFIMYSRNHAGLFTSTVLKSEKSIKSEQWIFSRAGRLHKKRSRLIILSGILIGILATILRVSLEVYTYYANLGKYCLVMEDEFNGPINTSLWKHEVSVGGFGNSEFSWATSNPRNSFVSFALSL